jgi:hypothetical protein
MTAPIYVILMGMVELAPEKHEKCLILVGLRFEGAENGVPDTQIANASATCR